MALFNPDRSYVGSPRELDAYEALQNELGVKAQREARSPQDRDIFDLLGADRGITPEAPVQPVLRAPPQVTYPPVTGIQTGVAGPPPMGDVSAEFVKLPTSQGVNAIELLPSDTQPKLPTPPPKKPTPPTRFTSPSRYLDLANLVGTGTTAGTVPATPTTAGQVPPIGMDTRARPSDIYGVPASAASADRTASTTDANVPTTTARPTTPRSKGLLDNLLDPFSYGVPAVGNTLRETGISIRDDIMDRIREASPRGSAGLEKLLNFVGEGAKDAIFSAVGAALEVSDTLTRLVARPAEGDRQRAIDMQLELEKMKENLPFLGKWIYNMISSTEVAEPTKKAIEPPLDDDELSRAIVGAGQPGIGRGN